MYNKAELIQALEKSFDDFAAFIVPLSPEQYENTPSGKWSAQQQLDHLTRAVRPINFAMRLPKFLPRLLFGKPKRVGYTYDEVVQKYRSKLQAGAKASGPYIPSSSKSEKRGRALQLFEQQKYGLLRIVEKWTENDLDTCSLPHPIIGKITMREMLFFTIYHIQHHLKDLQKQHEQQGRHKFAPI